MLLIIRHSSSRRAKMCKVKSRVREQVVRRDREWNWALYRSLKLKRREAKRKNLNVVEYQINPKLNNFKFYKW